MAILIVVIIMNFMFAEKKKDKNYSMGHALKFRL